MFLVSTHNNQSKWQNEQLLVMQTGYYKIIALPGIDMKEIHKVNEIQIKQKKNQTQNYPNEEMITETHSYLKTPTHEASCLP